MKPNFLIPYCICLILLSACGLVAPIPTLTVQPTPMEQPTQPPQPTNPPLPTQIPTFTPEPVPDAPSAPQSTAAVIVMKEPFRLEEFENEIDGWRWFTTSGSEDKTEIYRDRGRVVFELVDKDIYAYLMYDEYEYEDVKISTQVENRGKNPNSVSLVCRFDENLGWYEFNIGSGGLYTILRYEGRQAAGEYVLLANGGSNQIRTGQGYNEYSASCKEDTLTLWINGKETQSVQDAVLKEGLIGISASSYSGTPVIVEFEYVDISLPKNLPKGSPPSDG